PHLLVGERPRLVALAVREVVSLDARGGALIRNLEDATLNARLVSDESEAVIQACLLRDVFGSWFYRGTFTAPSLSPLVKSLANAAYAERAFSSGELDTTRLAVLADALEDTGGIDSEILSHLRSPAPHVRGCWALDLVLGKE